MAEYQSVRAFLGSIRDARTEKRRCEFRLEQLRSQCESVTAAITAAPGGGGGDVHKDALWASYAELGNELIARQEQYMTQIKAVEDFIARLPDARHRTILRLRYVDMLSWHSVHAGMTEYGLYYSERQMFDLHRDGLRAARKQWAEDREKEGGTP